MEREPALSLAHLADGVAVESLPPEDRALLARVQGRVMKAIAAESVRHHQFVQPEDGTWEPFLPGVRRKVLEATADHMCYLLRLAPGAVLPAHRHPADEETLVLQGALQVGPVLLPVGGWHRVARGVLDADATAVGETLIYVRGAVPEADQLV